MPPTASAFGRSYNSFSGVDIKAVFASKVIGELQAISYSITREKAPIYTMGSADPRSFSRGKRGIAGSLIFIMFDSHPLLAALAAPGGLQFQSDLDDIRPAYRSEVGTSRDVSQPLRLSAGEAAPVPGSTPAEQPLVNVGSDQGLAHPWYVDQMPPFDVTLAAANEYGAMAVMRIYGVELLNEGYGVSIDDIVSEQQMTYVARTIMPWASVPNTTIQAAISPTI